jgi:nodulation protein F
VRNYKGCSVGNWPHEFEVVLREQLPGLEPSESLSGEVPLVQYGLDSMGTVTLLVALESALEVQFPDEALVPETFETADRLWEQARRLLAGQAS